MAVLDRALPKCERVFVTSQGSAYGQFKRALKGGNPLIALAAARELPRLSLADAFSLLLVLRTDRDLYARAVARFHARYVIDTKLGAALLLAALTGLAGPNPDAAAAALRCLLEAHGEHHLASLLPEQPETASLGS